MKIAIIGSGITGLCLAQWLSELAQVTIFDKARGVGGRLTTRYAEDFEFDHGAPFFAGHDPDFQQFCQTLESEGVIAPWCARFAEITDGQVTLTRQWSDDKPHYVGVPRMNSVAKHLVTGLNIQLNCHIAKIEKVSSQWQLYNKEAQALDTFDWVILTAPPPQSLALAPTLFDTKALPTMLPCFALMLGFDKPFDMLFDAALVRNSALSWIASGSSKPGRTSHSTLTCLASNAWAQAHLELPLEQISAELEQEASTLVGYPHPPSLKVCHRWRFANHPKRPKDSPTFLMNANEKMLMCGDSFVQGKVEGAYLSAKASFEALKQHL